MNQDSKDSLFQKKLNLYHLRNQSDNQLFAPKNQQKVGDNIQKNDSTKENNNSQNEIQKSQQTKSKKTENQSDRPSICFSKNEVFEQLFFDSNSYNELLSLIPESLIQNYNALDLYKFFEDNPQYFFHLIGQCACKKCNCGLCKCDGMQPKQLFSFGLQSSYSQQFFKKNPEKVIPKLKEEQYSTKFGPLNQLDAKYQTSKHDFLEFQRQFKQKQKQQDQLKDFPFLQNTSYKQNFKDWADYDIIHFKRPDHVSTFDQIQLARGTSYQEFFTPNKQNSYQNDQKRNNNPIPQLLPFQGIQKNINTEIGVNRMATDYEVVGKRQQTFLPKNLSNLTPSYNGQFKTIAQNDFKDIQSDACLIKHNFKELRKIFINKMEEIREQRKQKQAQTSQ